MLFCHNHTGNAASKQSKHFPANKKKLQVFFKVIQVKCLARKRTERGKYLQIDFFILFITLHNDAVFWREPFSRQIKAHDFRI